MRTPNPMTEKKAMIQLDKSVHTILMALTYQRNDYSVSDTIRELIAYYSKGK